MNNTFRKTFLLLLFPAFVSVANAQLPNEKFGKPSTLEWDYLGWRGAVDADAIILCKTMKVSYQLSDQVFYNSQSSDFGLGDLSDFGKNEIDVSSILVKYKCQLRTKILKPEGVGHANIDITLYNVDATKDIKANSDELTDLKIKVFTKNEKGKVEKRSVNTSSFVQERVDDNYVVLHVVVPDIQPSSIIEYQYDISSNRPAFLYDWAFKESIPTVRSKCDIEIPAILLFNMNVPIHKHVKSSVGVGRLTYDTNRPDMKKGKSCSTNHYIMVADNILPEEDEIANFTSQIVKPYVAPPAYMPKGCTHLKVK